jgi:hypothetical protein
LCDEVDSGSASLASEMLNKGSMSREYATLVARYGFWESSEAVDSDGFGRDKALLCIDEERPTLG